MAHIISADNIKKSLPGYNPERSELLHRMSTRMADKQYARAVKERPENTVILMSGGAASGKTEYVATYLRKRRVIIFDGTLPSLEGAKIKIREARKYNKKIEIHAVLPEDFLTAFIAFLNRDRKFPTKHFYKTHSKSRKTLLEVAKNFPEIPVIITLSRYTQQSAAVGMEFKTLEVSYREDLIEFLRQNQYTESEIKRKQGLYDI